jgi:ACR3 family arsenite efflux pump ArsB
MAASVLALALFFNIIIFSAFSSEAFCTVLIVLIDIILVVSVMYLVLDNRSIKKMNKKIKN